MAPIICPKCIQTFNAHKDQVFKSDMEVIDQCPKCGPLEKGIKHDDDKLRWDLLPLIVIKEIVQVISYGAKKYGPNNWKLVDTERYYAALQRHITDWRLGEREDPETGWHHLAHAGCCLIFILWKELKNDKPSS